jgi:hypothetical protein
MGGKTLKYPKRAKYVPPKNSVKLEEESVSEEEHKKRMELLKQIGILKE